MYEYDAAGQVIKVTDRSLNQVTEFAYDLAGRHVRERTTQAGKVYQDNMLAYDNVGRLRHVGDGRMSIDIAYDKAGNRTQVRTHANVPNLGSAGEVSKDSDHRFTYDNMNRQTGVDLDENFQLTLGGTGHILTYDLDGNRASDKFFGNLVTEVPAIAPHTYIDADGWTQYDPGTPITYVTGTGNDDVIVERYAYDGMNRLTSVKRNGLVREGVELAPLELDHRGYDTVGRVITTGPVSLPTGYATALNSGTDPGKTIGLEARTNRYDTNGRLLRQFVYNSDRTSVDTDIAYQGYDAAGNLLKYELTKPNDYSNFYNYKHVRFDGYKESAIAGSSTKFLDGTTTNSYDVNGNLVKVADTTESKNNRSFVNDLAGHALYVNQDGNVQRQVVVNGEVLGRHGIGISEQSPRTDDGDPRFTQIADFDVGFQRITGNYPTASVGTYQVQAGDTLRSIARQSYGDEGLWYRIAETNGLTGDRDLRVGQTINIPSVVGSVHNNASTFKPYDPSKITGDTTPNLPVPEGDKGCGGIGMLLVIIVAVVVTIYTAGAAAAVMSEAAAAAGGGMAAGTAALGGTYGATVGIVAGAAGAAAGSVVSQAVAMGLGMQEDFSWNQVGLAALGGAISGGLAGVSTGSYGAASSMLSNPVTRAAVSNAMTQGVSVMVGAQDKFSWRGVAAAAAGAYVSRELTDSIMGDPTRDAAGNVISRAGGLVGAMGGDELARLGGATLLGFTAGITTAAARGGKVSVKQVATDAFGNALGESLADAMSSPSESSFGPVTPAQRRVMDDFGLGPRTKENAQGIANYVDWTLANTDLRGYLQPSDGEPLFAEPTFLASSNVLVNGDGTDPSPRPAAAAQFRVEIGGVGWEKDFQLEDGTWVLKSALDPDDLRRQVIDIPLGADAPNVPGYALHSTVSIERRGVLDAYYTPTPIVVSPATPTALDAGTNSGGPSVSAGAAVNGTAAPLFNAGAGLGVYSGGLASIGSLYTRTPAAGPYGALRMPGYQAHHLNQNAVYKTTISPATGQSILLRGNAFIDAGSPHYEAHASLERWWDKYRRGGELRGQLPTNAQYGGALRQSLVDAGMSPTDSRQYAEVARQQRLASGLPDDAMVQKIPRRIHQSGGNVVDGNLWATRGLAKNLSVVGKGLTGIGIAADSYSFYSEYQSSAKTGDYSNTYREGVRIAGGWAGAYAVGGVGAEFGAAFGLAFSPVGAVVGGFVGGLIGGGIGYFGGSYASVGVATDLGGLAPETPR
ncbi:LysM peptidoglycan-binding domain-containing protein [Rhizobacter sp. Root1221]|uniref:LysM peptidoglycan-binding domain-containing protein n=1 Tax=Rhizobacter sp. Root1221 TaxID=1736433 RepID=UPI001F215C55|nr:LysM peptidoglycan-binding domain-containing protein [Rhizobacter sp. Root1221]